MTSAPLLTIIVPTYNRAECLELLLTTLAREMAELEGRVGIIVGDNASTDRTPDVTSAFAASAPAALVIRHDANLGPDENFCRCVERVTSRYFWIIGDDDLPRAGAIRHVLELLATHAPDLVYLESDWRPEIRDNDPHDPVRDEAPDLMDSLRFARRVHVWTTFISGIVVDRESLVAKQPPEQLRRYSNTSLVQLGWVLGTLKAGTRFLVVKQKCILATQGNTGGYSVLKVFGNNFPSIVSDALGADSPLTRAIVRRCAVMFLPNLLWGLRFSTIGKFEAEDIDAAMRPQLGRRLSFWLLLRPIARWPRVPASMALRASGLLSKMIRVHDRLGYRRRTRSATA